MPYIQALATPEGCWHVNKCDPAAALSDGTPNYLGAAALKLAYDSWDSRGGMQVGNTSKAPRASWLGLCARPPTHTVTTLDG
jgi:hypothetical protein